MSRTLRRFIPTLTGLAVFAMVTPTAGAEEAAAESATASKSELRIDAPTVPAHPTDDSRAGRKILGLDIFALSGSLAEHKLPGHYGYALPWGRGPRLSAERTIGLGWGIRF
jgi:hypothetical protein